MIQNQRQYKITLSWIEKFEKAVEEVDQSEKIKDLHPKLQQAHKDGLQGQLDTLREEVATYECLTQGKQKELPVESFGTLATALIRARIVAGLTQKQLAERLNLKEQQIQRYEATGYRSADYARIEEVMNALGATFQGQLTLAQNAH
jgi:ribosome-binding protein aMBF1 (putative translation factor)